MDPPRPLRGWVAVTVVAVAAVALLLVLRSPERGVRRAEAAVLASPGVPAGRVGGLLPDVVLTGAVRTTPARELRPGVVALVANGCACVATVRQVVAAAADYGLVTYVVTAGPSLREAAALAAQAGGEVAPYADPDGTLAATYRLHSDAALVLVRADGVVTQVVGAVGPALRLGTALRGLLRAP